MSAAGLAAAERAALARSAAVLAMLVGLGYAAISGYWACGGSWLLDTVGGVFVRASKDGGAGVVAALWLVVVAKLVGALVPLTAISGWLRYVAPRLIWALAWLEAVVLVIYGFVLTGVGLLVQADVVHAGASADRRALRWHAYLWDPWFLVWGALVAVALMYGRTQLRRPRRVRRRRRRRASMPRWNRSRL